MEEALAFLSLPPSTPANGAAAEGVQRTWLDPKRPAKANLARPRKALGRVHGRAVRFGGSASGATLLAGEGIETVLSLVTAVPGIHAAAALSAGSLGAFEPPQDLALLVIARDKDVEGGHAANRLQRRCGTRHSLNRDRSRTLRFQRRPHCLRRRNPRGPDRAPYCKHQVRGNGGREAWEWENN